MAEPYRIAVDGSLDGRPCTLAGTLDFAQDRPPPPRRTLLSTLNQPFVLWLFSGLGLTLLTKVYDDRRTIRDQKAARIVAQAASAKADA